MYLALYRKYRPRTFDEVISQEHITTTLRNQVAGGTAAHAYLFTGSRGTGKTSCAKIMAMAVNCLSPVNGNPCLECERCREIAGGEATDIVEMDAASNNGVDEIRALRDEVAYTPVSCKYRVYIVDEVHMLSPSAFNALLKTLEEPPPHVKFILATTELHKVPATISSRCQRFEFRRVDISDSARRLSEVAVKENVQLDDDAAELISRLSDGGMRDALSLLDRCISAGEHITAQLVRDCAGVADNRHLFDFARMIAGQDTAGCIRLLTELHKGSKDPALLVDELSGIFRDIMLYKAAPGDTDLLSVLPEDHGKVAEAAQLYDLGNILRCLTLLQQCADNIGKTRQRKTLAEMCLVKMCTGAGTGESAVPAAVKPPEPSVRIKPPVQEAVKPKPYEEMSQNERLLAMETEKLIKKETSRTMPSAAPPAEIPAPAAAPPVEDAPAPSTAPPPAGSAPVETPAPSPFEDLPASSAAQPSAGSEPVETPAPSPFEDLPASSAAQPPAGSAPVETPAPDDSFFTNDYPIDTGAAPPEQKAAELTAERWKQLTGEMDFVRASMFSGTEARLDGNTLEVFTDDNFLLNNVKDSEHTEIESIISDLLGFPIRLRLTKKEPPAQPGKTADKLDMLLGRARQLGIEVQKKND